MRFLQPWVMWALPLIALPIVIHLVHRRRQKVVEWGAMMFLLAGSRLSRGWQKLRHFLILLARVLAVAGLVFAVGRPLAGGWLGSTAGGRPDAVIVLIDRSASMSANARGMPRVTAGARSVVEALELVEAGEWACIDGATGELIRLDEPDDLLDLPVSEPSSTTADIPAMLETALEYIRSNEAGRVEVWICSDLQRADWDPDSARWAAFRDAVAGMDRSVGVHVLSLATDPAGDLGVRATNVRRELAERGAELVLDLELRRDGAAPAESVEVPVSIVLGGARSVVKVTVSGAEARHDGVRLPLDASVASGWGRVELPADSDPSDNVYYFVYGEEPPRKTVVVAEDDDVRRVLGIAAEARLTADARHVTARHGATETSAIDLTGAGLLLWQAPLPEGGMAEIIAAFVDGGGHVVFLPPAEPTGAKAFGLAWGNWQEVGPAAEPLRPTVWRGDSDILAHAGEGRTLPLGELTVSRWCPLQGEGTPLARLRGGHPLLVRSPTERGAVYFFSTLPRVGVSNVAENGVVLVAMVQRALGRGVHALRSGAHREASAAFDDAASWDRASDGDTPVLSTEKSLHAGVLVRDDRLVALNRPAREDDPATLTAPVVKSLFAGLDVTLTGSGDAEDASLVEEIWKAFLVAMAVALVGEALLCLLDAAPRPRG